MRSREDNARIALRTAFFAFFVACGGSGPSFDGQVFRQGPVAFSIPPVPSGWSRLEVRDASLAYRDDAHGATIMVNARCRSADARTPLVALTNQLLIGATEREIREQKVEAFDGREAMHTTLLAKWDGVPMNLDVFVLSKDGCTYDFARAAARRDGEDIYEAWVRGFHTLPESGVVR
jgi:hypothetical protein